ncbi:shikimate dehydrogenase [Euzebya tangerina]|uniref:shikimate dehydrogenase n=1 Tax=Euzebya tangerina TaxID=591198 RepID=UPI0013C34081|nr:shikimate dehydrogenase [Euzebya tangerina]
MRSPTGDPTGPPSTDAETRLLAVLGHPVRHSLSPTLHSAAIAATDVNAVYLALDVPPDELTTALDGLVAIGFLGANLTIPHKAAALSYADRATAEAAFVGAANTLFWDDDQLVADNTDTAGLIDVLRRDCGVEEGDHVTIVGAGGAARACAVALGRLRAAVHVQARRAAAAEDVATLARDAGGQDPTHTDPRVVINATPLGRDGERLPERFMGLGAGRVALDLNYGQPSPFLVEAERAGGRAVDGLGMLLGQAEAAFERWTGVRPPAGVVDHALTTRRIT